MDKFKFIWEELRTSFWFLPISIIAVGAAVAVGMVYIDNIHDFQREGVIRYIFTGSANSARSVLSTISGAMIGVAGTVFSITLVALTLASSQFGPRLLRNFMHERLNQVVLGTYVATYVYCLIVLNSVKDSDSLSFIPILSVFGAILAAVSNIILLIIFIHHIAVSIQADKVISDINLALSDNIHVLFPDSIESGSTPGEVPELDKIKRAYKGKLPLKAPRSGYLQYQDIDKMFGAAQVKDLLILLYFKPGEYLVEGVEVGEVWYNEIVEGTHMDRLHSSLHIGKVRTPQQDAEFSIHQLVEIAARALSPGINDPYTAIACIDNLSSTLCHLAKVKFPSKYRYDEKGNLRIVAQPLTFDGMMDAAFNQIRQFSKEVPSVAIRLIEAFITIGKFAVTPEQKQSIKRHTAMVLRSAEKFFDEKNDLADLRERSRLVLPDGVEGQSLG